MKNQISHKGLDLIVSLLKKRISGYAFTELSVNDIGLRTDYSLYQVQTATEIMMRHLQMVDYTPVIQLCELPENVAGSCNLNDDKLTYIKLDKERFCSQYYHPSQLLTIIAHELCHKFLWIHGIKETSQKVEYITDACAVYVGFGSIIMSGIEIIDNVEFTSISVITKFRTVGYLEKWQIAYLRKKFYNVRIPFKLRKKLHKILRRIVIIGCISWVCLILLAVFVAFLI